MYKKKGLCSKKHRIFIGLLLAVWVLAGCGQEADSGGKETRQETDSTPADERVMAEAPETTNETAKQSKAAVLSDAAQDLEDIEDSKPSEVDTKEALMRERFGESCIASQTFEVSLSEYDGNVYFVPHTASADSSYPYIQFIQGYTLLSEFQMFIPEEFLGREFESLDAVSFYDMNYDKNTDILTIQTYGGTSFAVVYYGYEPDTGETIFIPQEDLSANLTAKVSPLTIPAIRNFLSGGKKNGEFADYSEAYTAVSWLYELERSFEQGYDLVYFDSDAIPELVAGAAGYYTSLYTYSNGYVYTLMDRWAYGAMGNAGYEFSSRKNSLRNYNTDYAGAILYTTYIDRKSVV